MDSDKEENGNGTEMFPYAEKWKDIFEWADPSALGEQYTYCHVCDRNLSTFHRGLTELRCHVETRRHKKRVKTSRQHSEPLPCSKEAIQFIRSHCYTGAATGERMSRRFARCKLGMQYPSNIQSVCQHTPYCVYIYRGVTLAKENTVTVVLVGFFDVDATRHSIQFLDAIPSVGGAEDQMAAAVVETLKKFELAADNLVAVYSDSDGAASEQICSHLRKLNPNIVALGGLFTIADAACRAGIKQLSNQVQELIADIHGHYSSCATKNSKLKDLFGSDSSENSPFPLTTSCLTFCLLVPKMLKMWTDLIQYFKSCNKNDEKAKMICSQLQEPKVRATFMFLEQALKPLHSFQSHFQAHEGAARADILLILKEASNLLGTYTSHFLRPQAAVRFLKEHNALILKNDKFHLPQADLSVGGKPVEDFLSESEATEAMTLLKQEATSFYVALTCCLAEELPLSEGLLRSIAQLLSPQSWLKVTGKAVGELGTKLGICGSPEQVRQLTDEYLELQLAEDGGTEEGEKDDSAVVSLENHWAGVLKDIKPASIFRKLVLTLLSLPCPPLEPQQMFTKV